LEDADAEVVQVSGGITNMLYRVAPKKGTAMHSRAAPILARVFGQAGDVVCDRRRENVVVAELSEMGFGPKLFGVFANGRLEHWYADRRPLEPLEMVQAEPVDMQTMIAKRLAEMHQRASPKVEEVDLWAQLRDWVALGKKVAFPDDAEKAAKLAKLNPYPRFEEQLDELEALLPSQRTDGGRRLLESTGTGASLSAAARRARELLFEERFCHLDLLSGNIMYSEGVRDVDFIDYEYSMRTCVGLDVANHFCAVPESCLILEDTFDVDKYYPSQALQRRWLSAYYAARRVELDEEVLDEMLKVVLDFALLAELRWVIWSVVQAGHSPVDFDYLDYGVMRFEQGFMNYRAWRDRGARP